MIGVSFGDSILIAKQRDVIQLMEKQYERLLENSSHQAVELQRWEALKPQIQGYFNGSLAEKNIFMVGLPDQDWAALEALLKEAGAVTTVIPLSEVVKEPEDAALLLKEAGALATVLANPEEGKHEKLIKKSLLLLDKENFAWRKPPDCCLLLIEIADFISNSFFKELWLKLHENKIRVIVLCPWREEEPPLLRAERKAGLNLIDNINTFWGQVALLRMLAGNTDGYYGFGKESAGLFPVQTGGS